MRQQCLKFRNGRCFTQKASDYLSVGVIENYQAVCYSARVGCMVGDPPENIRRGQTLQMELTLGASVETLMIPLGGFIQDTGGNWGFVLNGDGTQATRRDIVSGRRNNRYLEVREGLAARDRVITSGYGQMVEYERIELER